MEGVVSPSAGRNSTEPSPNSSSALSPEERLLALMVYTESIQMSGAKTDVNLNAAQLEKLREQVRQALDEARDAKQDAGFWGDLADLLGSDVATVAEAVAAVAAVVATGGAATAILVAVAAAASFAADHAKELGLPVEIAVAIAVTASIAGLCCGDGAGLVSVSQQVSDTAKDVRIGATIVAQASRGAAGGLSIVAGSYDKEAGYFQADARSGQGQQQITSADMDEAFDRFAAAADDQDALIKLTGDVQQQSAAADYAILNNWGGAA